VPIFWERNEVHDQLNRAISGTGIAMIKTTLAAKAAIQVMTKK
jgi:hypothetical protein